MACGIKFIIEPTSGPVVVYLPLEQLHVRVTVVDGKYPSIVIKWLSLSHILWCWVSIGHDHLDSDVLAMLCDAHISDKVRFPRTRQSRSLRL